MRPARGVGGILVLLTISFLSFHPQDIDPNSSKTLSSQELSKKALQAFQNRNLSESKRLYEWLWEKNDADLNEFTTAGRMLAYFEHHFYNNMDRVYPYFNKIIKRNPQKVDHYLRLSDYENRSHRFKQAKETLKKALKESPSSEQQKK